MTAPTMREMRRALLLQSSLHPDGRAVIEQHADREDLYITEFETMLIDDDDRELVTLATRLARFLTKDRVTGCWLWGGTVDHSGYPRTSIRGRFFSVPRIICALTWGPMLRQTDTRHSAICGTNRHCCNPDHLIPGSRKDNVSDRVLNCRGIGQRNADRRRVMRWRKRRLAAGLSDVRLLGEARWQRHIRRLPEPLVDRINAEEQQA